MPFRSPEQRIQELLEALRIGLDLDLAFVGEFTQGKRVFRFVAGGLASMEIEPGLSHPVEESYCHLIAEERMPGIIPDALATPIARDLAITEAAGIRSYVGIPLRMSDGRLFGSLCAAGTTVRTDLDEHVLDYVRNFARVIARELEEVLEVEQEHDRRSSEIGRLLDTRSFSTLLQPIVHLETGDIVSVEALTRFDTEPRRPPNEWFDEAWAVGLGPELELAAARSAVSYTSELDHSVSLAVNVSPATILMPSFVDEFAEFRGRLTLEVTEHAVVEDYQTLLAVIEALTDVGIKLAVDDVGAGYANLSHILELAPDVAKLDISLIKDIERHAGRHALVAALVAFAEEVDIRLVAEGIETEAALDTLITLGVRFGQGYLLARPAPAESVIRELAASAWRLAG